MVSPLDSFDYKTVMAYSQWLSSNLNQQLYNQQVANGDIVPGLSYTDSLIAKTQSTCLGAAIDIKNSWEASHPGQIYSPALQTKTFLQEQMNTVLQQVADFKANQAKYAGVEDPQITLEKQQLSVLETISSSITNLGSTVTKIQEKLLAMEQALHDQATAQAEAQAEELALIQAQNDTIAQQLALTQEQIQAQEEAQAAAQAAAQTTTTTTTV